MRRWLALLFCLSAALGPARADMFQDASNAALPAAPHNLGLSYAVKPGGDVQAALTAAAATGGTVNVQAGAYAPTTSLVVSSNTRIVCEPGAIFTVTNTGWSGPTVNGLNTALFINQNHAAASITDENISIEGCGLVATGTFAANSNYFHIYMRMARNVTVARNNFTAGGNAVSFLGTDKTLIEQNNATDTRHCWDHWEAPTRAKVYGGTCMNAFFGVLFTGTNTALTLAGMADDIEVIGGSYSMANVSGAMGMWFNGLRAGSGARNVRVKGAYIDMSAALTSPGPCVRASGGGSDMDIDVSCKGTTSATYALDASAGGDAGGFPSRVRFRGDLFGWTVSNLLVNMDAPDSSVDNLTCRSSTYTYIVGGSGSNVAANDLTFNCATGSSGRFNLTHATSGSACERTSAGGAVRCIGLVLSSSVFRLVSSTPASATAVCTAGDFAADAGFVYYCIAANQWRRAAMVAW